MTIAAPNARRSDACSHAHERRAHSPACAVPRGGRRPTAPRRRPRLLHNVPAPSPCPGHLAGRTRDGILLGGHALRHRASGAAADPPRPRHAEHPQQHVLRLHLGDLHVPNDRLRRHVARRALPRVSVLGPSACVPCLPSCLPVLYGTTGHASVSHWTAPPTMPLTPLVPPPACALPISAISTHRRRPSAWCALLAGRWHVRILGVLPIHLLRRHLVRIAVARACASGSHSIRL